MGIRVARPAGAVAGNQGNTVGGPWTLCSGPPCGHHRRKPSSPLGADLARWCPVNAVLRLSRADFDAVVMDLDGVVTDTASLHEKAWKAMFDGFLATRPPLEGEDHRPFENQDYRRFVDGMPRFDGALGFLTSRGITVPAEEVDVLAAQKDSDFQDLLAKEGAKLIPGSLSLLVALRRGGFRTAIVSASRNCSAVLDRAGLTDFFDASVDGVVAAELGLPGKPDPAVYLEAAGRLRTPPELSLIHI